MHFTSWTIKKYLYLLALLPVISRTQQQDKLIIAVPGNHVHYTTAAKDLQSLFSKTTAPFQLEILRVNDVLEGAKL